MVKARNGGHANIDALFSGQRLCGGVGEGREKSGWVFVSRIHVTKKDCVLHQNDITLGHVHSRLRRAFKVVGH